MKHWMCAVRQLFSLVHPKMSLKQALFVLLLAHVGDGDILATPEVATFVPQPTTTSTRETSTIPTTTTTPKLAIDHTTTPTITTTTTPELIIDHFCCPTKTVTGKNMNLQLFHESYKFQDLDCWLEFTIYLTMLIYLTFLSPAEDLERKTSLCTSIQFTLFLSENTVPMRRRATQTKPNSFASGQAQLARLYAQITGRREFN